MSAPHTYVHFFQFSASQNNLPFKSIKSKRNGKVRFFDVFHIEIILTLTNILNHFNSIQYSQFNSSRFRRSQGIYLQ